MLAPHILGIDIAKLKFDVCLRERAHGSVRHVHQFPNNPKGFNALQRWLRQHGATLVHACLEATSRYGDAVAAFLHAQGHTVSVVNPRRTRNYAHGRLVRTQNDAIDAALIADFCVSEPVRIWQPMATDRQLLQELVRTRAFFSQQKQQAQNRLETAFPTSAKLLRQQIRQLEATLKKLEKQLTQLLKAAPELARQVELASSIGGVGQLTAAVALAELPPIDQLEHAGQAVALAGLDPRRKTSGTSVHTAPRLSKMGSALLRQTLYMAALAALRCNPIAQALAQRLKAKGKGGKCAVAAVMRKLIRLIYGVLKQGQPFDPNWLERDRAVQAAGPAGDGDGRPSPTLASPSVATA
jgi:transposase